MPTDLDDDLRNAHELLQRGQLDEAVRTFVQVGDVYWLEERYVEADTVYRKVLEADRHHDHALWQLADIAARQGRTAAARQYLMHLIDLRTLCGDEQGLADCHARLQAYDARPAGAQPAIAPGREIDLSDELADLGGDQ